MNQTVLSMRRVGRTHGQGAQRVDALVDIDLDVAAGEWVAITGRSGSGKTTLLNVAGGLDEPTTGTVMVEGAHLGDMSKTELARLRRQSIGYVFQDFNLLPTLTAVENVALPLELDGMDLRKAKRQAMASLEQVGLARMADRYPDQMSGGEQQRVAIARGLVGPRTLLLADEPTGALDDLTSESILGIIRTRCDAGAAAVMVTHEPSFAAWADRVVRLRDGKIESITEGSSVPLSVAELRA